MLLVFHGTYNILIEGRSVEGKEKIQHELLAMFLASTEIENKKRERKGRRRAVEEDKDDSAMVEEKEEEDE